MNTDSQNRIDSIVALILEHSKTYKDIEGEALRVYYATKEVDNRMMEIMRTMEE